MSYTAADSTPLSAGLVWAAAEEQALADVDSFCDWLGSECFQSAPVYIDSLPREAAMIEEAAESASVAQLVAMLLYPSSSAAACAAEELRARYIKAHEAHILRTAGECEQ